MPLTLTLEAAPLGMEPVLGYVKLVIEPRQFLAVREKLLLREVHVDLPRERLLRVVNRLSCLRCRHMSPSIH